MSAVILTPADSRIVLLRSAAGYRIVRPSGYVLPVAGASTLGGVKVGSGLSVAGDGTLSATGGVWGSITGTLSSQSDLNAALAARALTSGTLAQFAATTSAELAGVLTDETGSGSAVFSVSPTLTTPVVSGTLTVRQTGGTPGSNEVQIFNDGSSGRILAQNGLRINGIGSANGQLLIGSSSGTDVVALQGGGTGGVVAVPSTGRFAFSSNTSAPQNNQVLALSLLDNNTIEVNNGTRTASGGALRGLRASTVSLVNPVNNAAAAETDLLTHTNTLSTGGAGFLIMRYVGGVGYRWVANLSVGFSGRIEAEGGIRVTGLTTLGTYTVGTLPSASANAGAFAQVTDSNSTTNGGIVAGGGANRVPVFSNGTNWIIK